MGGYYARKAAGLCPRCGKETDDDQHVLCTDCRELCRLWMKKCVATVRQKNSGMMKRLYQGRKDKGLCPRCGSLRDEEKYVMCKKCRASNAAAQRRFRGTESSTGAIK